MPHGLPNYGRYVAVGDFGIAIGKKAKAHQEWKRSQEKKEAERAAKKAAADDELEELERKIKRAELVKRAKEAGVDLPGDKKSEGLVLIGNIDSSNYPSEDRPMRRNPLNDLTPAVVSNPAFMTIPSLLASQHTPHAVGELDDDAEFSGRVKHLVKKIMRKVDHINRLEDDIDRLEDELEAEGVNPDELYEALGIDIDRDDD